MIRWVVLPGLPSAPTSRFTSVCLPLSVVMLIDAPSLPSLPFGPVKPI